MKRIKYISFFLALAFVATFSSCEDDDDNGTCCDTAQRYNLMFDFNASAGSQKFVLNEVFLNEDGHQTKLETFKFYISNLTLVKDDLTEVEVLDYALVDFKDDESNTISLNVPIGNYIAVKYGIGLDSAANASDPATFERDHPLGLNQGTYWSWASQYKFAMFDGRVDTVGNINSATDVLVSIHPGTNPLYRQADDLLKDFSITNTKCLELLVDVDIFKVLNGGGGKIDIVVDNQSHTTPSDIGIATSMMDNFTQAFTIE